MESWFEGGFGCASVIPFLIVWIIGRVSFGPLGFLLGWMSALIIAATWPLIIGLGVLAIVLIIASAIALYLYLNFFVPT